VSNNQDKPRFSLPVRVYYEDTNIEGTVYYANYLKFMERARIEWLRSLGFELDVLHAGVLFAVRHAEIAYLRPALLNDLLMVTVDLRAYGGASMDFVQAWTSYRKCAAKRMPPSLLPGSDKDCLCE